MLNKSTNAGHRRFHSHDALNVGILNLGMQSIYSDEDLPATGLTQSSSSRVLWPNEKCIDCNSVQFPKNPGFDKIISTAAIVLSFAFVSAEGVLARQVTVTPTRAPSIYYTARQEKFDLLSNSHVESGLSGSADRLIDRLQKISGLTLEFSAPLLGVSRRTLQNWKSGGVISLKNEEKLRQLLETTEIIHQGSAAKTKDLLLKRIPGYLRVYDLLLQGRFTDAIARSKSADSLQPIRSNPNLKFDHLPLAVQLSRGDDGPFIQTGLRVRKLLRRSKAES
jgi:hypothetical protein